MSPFPIRLTFHGDLPFFLGSKASTVERQLSEKTSVKDVIEACGVPHTEVDLIIVNGVPVDFACVVDRESSIEVIRSAHAELLLSQKIGCNSQKSEVLLPMDIWGSLSGIFAFSASTSFTIPRPRIDNW